MLKHREKFQICLEILREFFMQMKIPGIFYANENSAEISESYQLPVFWFHFDKQGFLRICKTISEVPP